MLHETFIKFSVKLVGAPPVGLANDHEFPSQFSMTEPPVQAPTAAQNWALGQETEYSAVPVPGPEETSGTDWMVQVEPFHSSVSGEVSMPVVDQPTAMQNVSLEQATDSRVSVSEPGTFSVVSTVHDEPSHSSPKVARLGVTPVFPTAMQ